MSETNERYMQLCHAMQSGVAYKMQHDSAETQPKHLRVGINSALVCNAALLELLFERGVFTREQYEDKLNEWMEKEVESYRKWLSDKLGKPVVLA